MAPTIREAGSKKLVPHPIRREDHRVVTPLLALLLHRYGRWLGLTGLRTPRTVDGSPWPYGCAGKRTDDHAGTSHFGGRLDHRCSFVALASTQRTQEVDADEQDNE